MTSSNRDKFEMPWQYNFPPFFTLQPNLDTQKLQLEAWCALVLKYFRANRQHLIDVNEAQSSPLFQNSSLNRKLSLETIHLILEELRRSGNLEWTDKQKKRAWILWRSVDDWGKVLYSWAVGNGMSNTVCTLYELIHGHDTSDEGMPAAARMEIPVRYRTADGVVHLKRLVNSSTTMKIVLSLTEFHNMDQDLMVRALRCLEQQKKAELISVDGSTGVKFF